MKTTHKTITKTFLVLVATLGVLGAAWVLPAGATSRVVVTGSADVRVWVNDTYDVFPSYDDVAISLRADRDCYVTVLVVDTDGFVHVVHPLSPRDNAWVYGGRTYRYTAFELGLARLDGRGVAHVFAISSPYPFDYSHYGVDMFAGGCGYRIYGDPFVACREIYISLLPVSCRWDFVGVSFARFYIREWTRYPHYLCRGHHGVHVRVGDYCPSCAYLYDGYRVHLADPYVVIHPRVRFAGDLTRYAEVRRSTVKYKSAARESDRRDVAVRDRKTVARDTKSTVRETRSVTRGRVVSTSNGREAVAGWTRARGEVKAAPTTRSVERKSAPEAARKVSTAPARKPSTSPAKGTKTVRSSASQKGNGANKSSGRTSAKKAR